MRTATSEMLDPGRTALMIVDVQHDFCGAGGAFAASGVDMSAGRRILPALAALLNAARRSGASVVYLRFVEDADGHVTSEAYDRQRYSAGGMLRYCVSDAGKAVVAEVAPQQGEPVVDKVRASGFFNTALDTILRCAGVRTIILTGMATDSCVLATAIDATARDYDVVLARDCLASFSEERHRAAMSILAFKHPVLDSEELSRAWLSSAMRARPSKENHDKAV